MEALTNMLSAETISKVKSDWYKFGVAYVVAQLLMMKQLDKEWAVSTLLTLLGFTAYQVFTSNVIDSGRVAHGTFKNALDDVLKFGTMLIVSHLLSGGSIYDPEWQKETATILAGFVAYDLVTYRVADAVGLQGNVNVALNDVVKYGTMFVGSRLLMGKPLDREWAISSGAFVAGLVVWDLVLM